MGLFCPGIKRDSVSLLRCPRHLACNFSSLSLEVSRQLFSSHFNFLNFLVFLFVLMLALLLLAVVICLSLLLFVYSTSLWIVTSALCWLILLFLLFLPHRDKSIPSLECKILCFRICFLVLWFIWVPPMTILTMVKSILQGTLPTCLFLCRDFCRRVCFWEFFFYSFEVLLS